MVESTRPVHSRDPYDRFDEAISDSRLYETLQPGRAVGLPYQPPEQEQDDALAYEAVPLFLSNYDDEEPKHRFGSGGERNISRALLWSRILKGGIAAATAAGIALAIMSMDNPLSVFANAKASLAGDTSGQLSATEPALPPQSIAARPTNSEPAPDSATPRRIQPAGLTSVSPSRDEIAAAYQGAIKSKVVAIEPATQAAAPAQAAVPAEAAPQPAARRIAPDELAALLKRAKGLLAIGDITSARLLLERAADAQEADAALMLAGTYDPQVLGTQDMRSITPDPAAARLWYQKAAQLGSVDARRRLQTQN
jgi:TPR repeat protein